MIEIFVLGLFATALYIFVCFLLWRILRRLEWLSLYIKGVGDTLLKESREMESERKQRN